MISTVLDWRISKAPVLLSLWALWSIVHWYAVAYSPAPNQIHWAYGFSLLGVACLLFPGKSPLALLTASRQVPGLRELLFLIGLYFVAFYIVSFWELHPGTTLAWGKFEIVNLVAAATFYIVGRSCTDEQITHAFYYLGVALVALTILQIAVDREAIRYGYGWQLMLCLPAALLLHRYWFVAIALVVMLASQHKAALGCAVLAVSTVFVFARLEKQRRTYVGAALGLFAFGTACAATVMLYGEIERTIERFREIDAMREFVAEASMTMLSEYFPWGMGYMNFQQATIGEVPERTSRLGYEVAGISLHNSYLSWVLEGGVLVTASVLIMFWRIGKRVRATFPANRNMGALMLAWLAALALLAVFHQVHQMMQFWGTIGLIFGYHARLVYDEIPALRRRCSADAIAA